MRRDSCHHRVSRPTSLPPNHHTHRLSAQRVTHDRGGGGGDGRGRGRMSLVVFVRIVMCAPPPRHSRRAAGRGPT